jgi:diadenylate cyclase
MLAGIMIVLILLTTVSDFLKFEVISWLLNNLWAIIATAILVIFQPELRRAFAQLGSSPFSSYREKKQEAVAEVVNAVLNLSRQRFGALLVFEKKIGMSAIVDNAIPLDVRINSFIIESIFYPNSPLHDGAVIIKDDRIVAAHAILPLPSEQNLFPTLGTRHRAAIGITEETDSVTLVVSEETGMISVAYGGKLLRNIKPERLSKLLYGLLMTGDAESFLQSILGGGPEDGEGGFDNSGMEK